MKVIEKSVPIPKALLEVWEWKDEVYEDIKGKSFEEKEKYFGQSLKEAAHILKGRLQKNADSSYSIVK